ncbi:tetratricopeptide repeat protein 14 isoform X3 [Mauremys mutica]|uniref:tetratricopeptide repeat protein 14 isoform X3 n=1 Tax=Mauremys mutica TaxID=74926 RepID=UPI001D16E0C3|nr:tetratricopeptide repeat protein 14 isoform X3 [Mauremys mutica]
MERDLLRQALGFHGPALLSLLRTEQRDNPDFRGLLPPAGPSLEPSREAQHQPPARKEKRIDNIEIQHFIAKKADLLFALSWKPNVSTDSESNEENEDCYAVMPPLEQFMEVPSEDRRELFFRDIERGDVVIGRISSIREFGFFMVLICLGSGVVREISQLEITALCPLRDVPSHSSHGDPLSYYQTGDIIQAAIKDIDRYHEKLTISLHSSALPPSLSSTKLGVISSEDLPLHYRRSVEVASTSETYEKVLHHSLGFANPSVVEFLLGKLGLSESSPPSLMRGLQSKSFNEEDFAFALRKKQSASWALKCVKIGVDYFKVGRHVEAMNEYNKALEIDAQNVEALVARGALYATKGSLNKAIDDFEVALKNCPTHRNARKYLCQTLVERGGQLEEEDNLLNAQNYYKRALILDETFKEAEDALLKLRKHMQQAAKEERQKEKKIETSAQKLRKLLKEEKRLKKKRRRSTSSSSSSSSDSSSDVSVSSSSSSSDHKRHKKRSRNRSVSSCSSKKHSSRVSSHQRDQSRKDEWYSPPADTSASFLNQKYEMEKLLERQDRLVYQKTEVRERQCSLSRTSADEEDTFGGRSEDSRDSYGSSKTQSTSSKNEKQGKADRSFSNRRSSSGSYHWKSDDKINTHDFRKLEKEVAGRKEQFRKRGSSQSMYSTSPAGSDYSGKSVEKNKQYSSTWLCEYSGSDDGSRRELTQSTNERREYKNRDSSHGEATKAKELDEETTLNGKGQSESGVKKSLPQNLLNIFNQIAEFERQKGSKQKNQSST